MAGRAVTKLDRAIKGSLTSRGFCTSGIIITEAYEWDSTKLLSSKWTTASSIDDVVAWWRHQMETFSALLAICAGNSPVIGEFPAQRPVTRTFDVFFDLRLNKPFSTQSWGWWFETPSRPLCRHRNGIFHQNYFCNICTIATLNIFLKNYCTIFFMRMYQKKIICQIFRYHTYWNSLYWSLWIKITNEEEMAMICGFFKCMIQFVWIV